MQDRRQPAVSRGRQRWSCGVRRRDRGAEPFIGPGKLREVGIPQSGAQAVSEVHARYFGDIRPANTLIVVEELIGGYAVEIKAEAELD